MELTDKRQLEAAKGWIGLGNLLEANEELERVTPQMRAHPDVLCLRWTIYSIARKWDLALEVARRLTELEPDVAFRWIGLAKSLHELRRTQDAHDVLLLIVEKFPREYLVPYDLARYACLLGDLKEAWSWIEKAIDLEGKAQVRLMALDDPDLEPLWTDIAEI